LLVLQGTVGAQKIGVVGNTMQVLLQFSSGVSLPKIINNRPRSDKVIAKIKKGAVFLKHSVEEQSTQTHTVIATSRHRQISRLRTDVKPVGHFVSKRLSSSSETLSVSAKTVNKRLRRKFSSLPSFTLST